MTRRAGRRLVLAGGAALALGGAGWWQREPLRRLALQAGGLRIVEERETPFGRLAVVERGRRRFLAYGPGIEIVYQSVLDLDRPLELAAPYMRLMMLGMIYAQPARRVAMVGLGAGNMAVYLLRTFPEAELDAIEIDPDAADLGRRHFGLAPDPRLRVHIADGRAWLEATRERFDVLLLDAYDDRSIPPPLAEPAFFATVAARLAPGGVAMQNVYLPGVDTQRLLAAMRAALPALDAYRFGDSLVLAAGAAPLPDPAALAARAAERDAALRPAHPFVELLARRSPLP